MYIHDTNKRNTSLYKILAIAFITLIFLDLGLRFVLPKTSYETEALCSKEFSKLYASNSYGRLKSNLDVKFATPYGSHTFRVQTNSHGMRMKNVSPKSQSETIRVAVMGSSVGFGWLLPQEYAYPTILQKLLNRKGKQTYQVLNFAAPGYTSFHALKQYERLVHNFNPDILILSYGLYDSFESRLSEKEVYELMSQYGLNDKLSGFPRLWHDYSTIGQWMISNKRKEGYAQLEKLIQEHASQNVWKKKVKAADFIENLRAVIQHHQSKGGKSILVHLNLMNFHVYQSLNELSEQMEVPLLDIRTLFDNLGGIEERKKTMELGLKFSGTEEAENSGGMNLLFRIYVPQKIALNKSIYIQGNHPKLGGHNLSRVKMYDDGTHGDEKDRVCSLKIEIDEIRPIQFSFTHDERLHDRKLPSDVYNTIINHQHIERVNPVPFSKNTLWTSLLYIYGQSPYHHLLLPDSPALPNVMGQKIIARRLASLVLKTEESQ